MSATLHNFDPPSLMAKEIYNLEYRITELEDALSVAEVERDNALLDYKPFKELREWVAAGRRQVDIVLGGPVGLGYEHISVFDFELNQGQDITDVREIDLIARKKAKADWFDKKAKQIREEVAIHEQIRIDQGTGNGFMQIPDGSEEPY